MSAAPSLLPPRDGISINLHLAYVTKASAVKQAQAWNDWLRDDPVLGPSSGFRVGVGARDEGRFPLVWEAVAGGCLQHTR